MQIASCRIPEQGVGFRAFLMESGAVRLIEQIERTASTIAEAHSHLARAGRAEALSLPMAGFDHEQAIDAFDTARRHGSIAAKLVREWAQVEIISKAESALRDDPEFSERIAGMRREMKRALYNADLPADFAKERLDMFEMAVERVSKSGLVSSLDYAADQIDELNQVLRAEEDWGRKPHAPIPWWAWALIIALIIVGIALVVVCFITSGCAWMTAIIGVAVAIV